MERASNRNTQVFQTVLKLMGVVMAVLYLVLGTLVIFLGPRYLNIPAGYSTAFGIVLITYGSFRGYRVIRQNNKKDGL